MNTTVGNEICLLCLNARKSHSNLAFLNFQTLLQQKHPEIKVHFLDHTINSDPRLILRDVISRKPAKVFFSVYIWNKLLTQNLIYNIKQISPDTCIIIGGPEAEFNSQWWLENSLADHLFKGPLESRIEDALNICKTNIGLQIHEAREFPINQLPFPYNENILAGLEGRLAYYEASRGCQFRCSYCVSAIDNKKVTYQDINKVLGELKILAFSKVKVIKMVDRTFNYNTEFAHQIWEHYIQWNPPVPIHFEIHPALLTDECFSILENAPMNLFQLEIGIQSTNQECLKKIHRFDKWTLTKENIARLGRMKNLHLHVDQIVGLPESTIEIEKQSFNDIIGIKAGEFQLGFLKILPGTPLEADIEKYGIRHSAEPPYQILQTASLPYEEVERLTDIEFVLGRIYNSGYFRYTIEYILSATASAFDVFDSIRKIANKLIVERVKRWEDWAECILLFARNSGTDIPAILDYLRIDWGFQSKSQFFPPVLSEGIEQHWQKVKSDIKSEVCNETITPADFKRSLFIQLLSSEAKKQFNCSRLLVLHPNRKIMRLKT